MADFLSHYYGAGWENIREYLDIVCAHGASRTVNTDITQWPRDTLPGITNAEVRRCDQLWENAKAGASSVELERLERSEISWRFWKCCHYKSEFSLWNPLRKRMQEKAKLYNAIKEKDIIRLGGQSYRELTENMALVLLRPAEKWCDRFDDVIWQNLKPLGNWLYKVFVQ